MFAEQHLRERHAERVALRLVERERALQVRQGGVGGAKTDVGPADRASHLGFYFGGVLELGRNEGSGAVEHLAHGD